VIDGAQILRMPPLDQERLRVPEYVVTGGALSKPLDSKGEVFSTVLRAALRAVTEHNETPGLVPISRVGCWEGLVQFQGNRTA
jgi:hypothetical protein